MVAQLTPTMKALEIKNLHKTYSSGHQALNGVSFEVKKGEIFGLLGPNGAGKTTTINIMAGVVNKTAGEVSVLNTSIDEDHLAVKKKVGVVPQELVYDRFFTVEKTLQYQAGYYGISDAQDKIDELLKALSLEDKRNVSTGALSGGMKRRLMVAKALVHDPDLVVLDEPTAGVDIELRWGLWEYVKELHKRGKTIILTTHYLEEAEAMCDRLAILDKGNVLAIDTVSELKKRFGSAQKKISFTLKSGKLPAELPFEITTGSHGLESIVPEDQITRFFSWADAQGLVLSDIEIHAESLDTVFHNIITHG